MSGPIVCTRQAQRDARRIASSNLKPQAQRLLEFLAKNPFQNPSPDEKFIADLAGTYSRHINIQHPLVHQVYQGNTPPLTVEMWASRTWHAR